MVRGKPYSLKKRLIVILLTSSFIPVVLIGLISFVSLDSLLNNNIDSGISNNLSQIRTSLDYTLSNLDRSALLLALNGRIVADIEKYILSQDNLEKYEMKKEIQDDMAIVSTVKPDLGVIFFYLPETQEILFENRGVDSGFDCTALPVLAEGIGADFYSPHATADSNSKSPVFSLARKLNLIDIQDVFVYLETDVSLFKNLLGTQLYNQKIAQVLVDASGTVVFSQNEGAFPAGSRVDVPLPDGAGKSACVKDGYFVFSQKGELGWRLMGVISVRDYNAELIKWAVGLLVIALVSVAGSVLMARSLWRTVYMPLRGLNKEIGLMAQSEFGSPVHLTGVREFDSLLGQFERMKEEIARLFGEVREKEARKRIAEVEKLMHQINPHFIHNTLNTIQWMARMNGQDEIDRFVALFTRVLHYNLGKEGGMVPLREEIEALRDYVELQKMRYKYQFEAVVDIGEELMDVSVPRFLLQPIVENAIYHGLRGEGGLIVIAAGLQDGSIAIRIRDNGAGMTQEEAARLLAGMASEDHSAGLGIGLGYVKHIMGAHYGGDVRLDIESRAGWGTEFTLVLPVKPRPGTEAAPSGGEGTP